MSTILLLHCVSSFLFAVVSSISSTSHLHVVGVHPLDEKYFDSDVIKCKDGSNSFHRDRLNDNFCDCLDGTDEPGSHFLHIWQLFIIQYLIFFPAQIRLWGTSACPNGKFYCRNIGSSPKFIYSSRVNDRICDCCDGSDEYGSSIHCPNTCIMGGNVNYIYKPRSDLKSIHTQLGSAIDAQESKTIVKNLQGMKLVVVLQLVFVGFVMILWILMHRARSKRRHSLLRSIPPNRSA